MDRKAGAWTSLPKMRNKRIVLRSLVRTFIAFGLTASHAAGQENPAANSQLHEPGEPLLFEPGQEPLNAPAHPTNGMTPPCIQPAPTVRIEDYQGPFRKVVGTFAGRLERRTVHEPHYKPGVMLCTLRPEDKFVLSVRDFIDPVTFLGGAFFAGLDQAQNADPSYGQGAQGYSKRFGAELGGQATSTFFLDFAYPALFKEDPRYYRLAHGPARSRLLSALEHSVVAHRDNGNKMFNFSEWLGTASTVLVNNTYHPDYRRGVAPAAERVAFNVLTDAGFDVLREFWPEVAHKLRLPFRGEPNTIEVKPTSPN